MTRAGQAKALGIVSQGKGHLGIGAEADIAIYPIRTDSVDPAGNTGKWWKGSRKPGTRSSGDAWYRGTGRSLLTVQMPPSGWMQRCRRIIRMENDPEFIKRFEQFYTVRMSNYPVQDVYLPRGRCIETEAFT